MMRYFYLLIDLTTRNNVLALLISIINPLVALLLIIFLYFNLRGLSLAESNPDLDVSSRFIPILMVTVLLGLQAFLEAKALVKVSAFLAKR
jgi:hypothetical protein